MALRVAVYGGSFSPFGNHHLEVIRWLAQKDFDSCWVVPSVAHALKKGMLPYEHRINMAREAVLFEMRRSDAIQIEVSLYELEMLRWQKAPIYTIDLLRSFQKGSESDTEFRFVIGPDILEELHRWRGVDEIRSEFGFIEAPDMGIHSSEIRECIADGFPGWKDHVPPNVIDYIERHGLYLDE